jgi:hypothetical protein
MLRRFSLYGFLKNQQYYEYFLILAFRQMGLPYFMIGLLIAFREIMVNVMEVPSGAAADLLGKRDSMIFSFISYIISFAIFGLSGMWANGYGLAQHLLFLLLCLAMFFFAIGEAFRTGTHKALIFAWLRIQGRIAERTRVYGYTRSWSKIGSAFSVIVACILVFITSNFILVFFFSIVPYILNIVNFLGYPGEIDYKAGERTRIADIVKHLRETLMISVRRRSLRRLVLESMGFEGFFKASKDYLQPILMAAALPLTSEFFQSIQLTEEQSSVLLIGPVYVVLFLMSAVASRNAYWFVARSGHEDKTARALWGTGVLIFSILLPSMYYGMDWIMITGFIALYVIQNLWRPVLISRFDSHSDEAKGATVLSIESQAKSLSTMVIAPPLGFAVDLARNHNMGTSPFWPIGFMGLMITLVFFLTAFKKT